MLKISKNTKSMIQPEENGVRVGGDSRAGRDDRYEFSKSELDGSEVDGNEVRDDEVEKKDQKMFKSEKLSKYKKTIRSDFLTPEARLAFTKLRQVFIKALIFYHFDLKCHIRVETDTISGVFN